MGNKVRTVINILVIIFMPFMMYVNINGTKINVSLADTILVLVGVVLLFDIKEFFIKKRWLYLLYFVGLLLSLYLSQYISKFNDNLLHAEDITMILEMLKTVIVAVYFFAAFIFVKDEKDYRLTLTAISISSVPVIFIGLLSYIYFLLGKEFFIDVYKIETLRFYGSFEDPNLCALYFIVVFFVSLLNVRAMSTGFHRATMIVISLFSFIAIILTMSRGGWLAFAVALVFYVFLNMKDLRKEILMISFPIIIIVLIFANFDYQYQQGKITNSIIGRIQISLSKDSDEIDRVHLMKAAILMGNDNFFFGVGKGGYQLNSYKYLPENSMQAKRMNIPHNTILGFYAQQGIVGALIFIMLPGYIIFRMIRSGSKQNSYLLPLYLGLLIHSMTINIENVRFVWFILGLMLSTEKFDIHDDFAFIPIHDRKVANKTLLVLLLLIMLLFIDLSRKMAVNIYLIDGDIYERKVSGLAPGDYYLGFDIQTDNNAHVVNIYDGNKIIDTINFKSSYGAVLVPIHINEECKVVFESNADGWMKVKNAFFINADKKVPLYNYVLLPQFIENWSNDYGLLIYLDEASFRKLPVIEDDKLNNFELTNGRVTRFSNLSHAFQFDFLCRSKVDVDYQLDLILDFNSITSLLPSEDQSNIFHHRFFMSPNTSKWEEGQKYIVTSSKLISSEDFKLYGRYYDYIKKIYSQDSFFPIHFDLQKKNQSIIELGENKWINIRYNKDKEDLIHMDNNGWVETGRMKLPKGDYEITFKAQGSFLEEYSKLRLRNSYLDEITEIILDGTMKEYTVKYHVDGEQQGISFILELVNYKTDKDIGNREVLLEDWVRVK